MKKNSEGILYPYNAEKEIKIERNNKRELKETVVRTVPHKAWHLCKAELDGVFSELSQYRADNIIVLSPLHGGRLISDKNLPYTVYTYEGEDTLNCPYITEDNDVCSEEFSFEILLPYLEKLFPSSKYHAFFAPGTENEEEEKILSDIVKKIKETYRPAIILLSDNSGCCSMWEKALTARI